MCVYVCIMCCVRTDQAAEEKAMIEKIKKDMKISKGRKVLNDDE